MDSLTLNNFITLGMLVLLQAVLGFDNLLYISLESKSAPKEKQAYVRKLGIGLAIILRIGLLFLLVSLIKFFQKPLFNIDIEGVITGEFTIHSFIIFVGGVFIVYTAMKEIWHIISFDAQEFNVKPKQRSITKIVTMIVIMNLVFSFDSILSAMALTDVFWVMALAVIIGGILMIWLAGRVAKFLQKNKLYEVLGLFILFLVGIMLLSEFGHISHLHLFGEEITPMSKATFYFIIVILVIIDIIQGSYQKKLMKLNDIEIKKE